MSDGGNTNWLRRVLVLAPHTDDGELGCGGAIARFVEEGRDVHCVAFSGTDLSLGPGVPPDKLAREMHAAMRELGVAESHIRVHSFPVRRYLDHRQDILDILVALARELEPDLVLMPHARDLHQDHAVVAAEGMRAFKRRTILCYELPWNTVSFHTEAFIKLDGRHVEAKVRALACYESQRYRQYLSADFLRGWARTRGVQIGCEYAECFEVPRLVF